MLPFFTLKSPMPVLFRIHTIFFIQHFKKALKTFSLNLEHMRYLTIVNLLILFIIMTTSNSCNEPNSETRALESPFCHHVFFWLNNPSNEQERSDFEKGIEKLLEIPQIK